MAVVVIGAALRLAAARGELWLDEIWSLELARQAGSAVGVLTSLHHDNNHHLTTLWLHLVGPDASPVAHRLLAIASGVALLAMIASARGVARGERLAWVALAAASPALVQYGSEARGYAPAMACAVAAWLALGRLLEAGGARPLAAFAAATVLGLASHLTFLHVLLGLGAWAGVALATDRAVRARAAPIVLAFLVPAAALVALWLVDLRHVEIGGGPEYQTVTVLRRFVRAVFGLPAGVAELAGLGAMAVAAYEVARLARERRPEAAFFAVAIVVGPALVVVVTRPEYLAPRYFVVVAPFVLLLVARPLARAWAASGRGALGAGVALAAFLVGSGAWCARLVRDGRGTYRAAVEAIVREAPADDPTFGLDHEFRNRMVFAHYARAVPGGEALVFEPAKAFRLHAPTFWLTHDLGEDCEEPRPPATIEGPGRKPYRLVHDYRTAPLSGLAWHVYRREGPP